MKKLLCVAVLAALLIGVFAVFASADSTSLPFTDVPKKQWYYNSVAKAYELGLMKGKTETKFDPTAYITRAEVVMIFANIAKANTEYYGDYLDVFSDVKTTAWYADAMGWAYDRGLVSGYTDSTIRPNARITRREFVKMVGNYVNMMYYDLAEVKEDVVFTDAKKIEGWYKAELELAASAGIISGDNKGNFNPKNNTTRAEAATIMTKLVEAIDRGLAENGLVVARDGEKTPYTLFASSSDPSGMASKSITSYITSRISCEMDVRLSTSGYTADIAEFIPGQIILAGSADPDMQALQATLGDDDYAIKVVRNGEYHKVLIGYNTALARTYVIELIMTKYVKDGTIAFPYNLDERGTVTYDSFFKTVDSITVGTRDPYVVYKNGAYYLYETNWRVYKNTSGDLEGDWTLIEGAVEVPADCRTHKWAPEVHEYKGSYYMFTTYKSKATGLRGCVVFKADSPEGPFVEISESVDGVKGHLTKGTIGSTDMSTWDAIDGTLYVDGDGQPWMIFTHESTSRPEGYGRFMAAKLSDDLTHFISEPFEMFSPHDVDWSGSPITDGCFMYTNANGELLMLWSSNDTSGKYTVAVSRSDNGKLDGNWIHDEDPFLFKNIMIGTDGGHGSLFTDVDGQMYMVCHAPQDYNGTSQRATFTPVIERNGHLVWDLNLD